MIQEANLANLFAGQCIFMRILKFASIIDAELLIENGDSSIESAEKKEKYGNTNWTSYI
jgi:hypothetical protein